MMATIHTLNFTLNGAPVSATIESHHNLVELLQKFNLFGARESCGQGLCGCCTTVVDGKAVSGCIYLAALVDGKDVRTVEHLDANGRLNPIQAAFVEAGAFQCGFCTPGFIMMTEQLLDSNPDPSDGEIRDYLAGNLCRCAAYPEIVAAVKLAARKRASAARA
jgi:aerobic carbon-monoxide dehydrogenase small subunit